MPVSTVRKELKRIMPYYDIIRDCVAGELRIKFRKEKYLPRPNAADTSPENQARYAAYLTRAVYYNVVKRTRGGMVGQIFAREPIIEIPAELDVVKNDATGFGVQLVQLSKEASENVVAHGRCGLFIDYPVTNGPTTKADLAKGDIRPTIKLYEAWNIINWRTMKRGGREILSMVVLEESYIKDDDGFEEKEGKKWKVLRLDDAGAYVIHEYTENKITTFEVFTPTDSDGNRLTEIPFTFIGADNNDPTIDGPPLFDLASLNIAHYRNSADYEESCYITGQPTPYFTGLTEAWVTNVLKGVIPLGARAAVPLPVGASAGLLQAQANSMPFEAMEHKERQMVALGAKLVEQTSVQRTATEAGLEHSDETSILSASADNVSDAVTFALKWCGVFVGIQSIADLQKHAIEDKQQDAGKNSPDNEFKFELNTEFDLIKLTPQERMQVITEWQAGAISWSEMRANMRRAGVASQADDLAKTEIDSNPPPAIKAANDAAKLAAQQPKPGGTQNPNNPNPKKPPKQPGKPAATPAAA